MTFGEKLKLLRYEKGLTQDDLGYILNVTKSCVSCYESGQRQPSIDVLISLSIFFKVSVDFLIGIEPYSPSESREMKITKKDVELLTELKKRPILYREITESIPNSISKLQKIFK